VSRISVIIPTYNRAALLREAIESVLAQTRAADEIIVVDDGSTDDTRATVADREQRDGRVRYVWQPNAFQSAARNNGVRHATGDLLLFLDSDDRLLPDALGRLEAAIAARPDAALAYGRARLIDTSGALVRDRWEQEDHDGHVWDA
jgi:glycosyltransferase involved in cell wall biosynthesis